MIKIYKHQCIICGKEFYSETHQRKYCSNRCRIFDPHYIIQCKYCGKLFFRRRGKKSEYCSITCKNKDRAVIPEIRHCLNCGKEIKVYPHQIKRNKGKYCSPECQFKHCNSGTDIEMMVKKWLDEHNVKYEYQYHLDGKFYPDFYLPDKNIILEVQGDYWHANPKIYSADKLDERQKKHIVRDKRKFGYYKHKGIKYYELWGLDIKQDINSLMKTIKEIA